ncbi:hypothetical protein GBAR_LOCUS6026 [Geodia barretti]|uniref:Uncharacterized protein n=1 Tax=Geodia barretti TaxID=519541 RepID=A0AA35RCB8_GEOBA|nr:hypothetical protein GBAR_LOCUS6026 [Geodia barretti]
MLRMEIIHQRTRTKDHLKRQTLHSKLTEAEIASTEQQLQAIVTENLHICKLHYILKMAKDLQLECIWMREHQKGPKMDMVEVSRIRENLATQWSNDQKMEEEHKEYCDMILSKTELLSRQVEKRLKQLDHVYNEQLFEEPETLAASHL